MSETHATPVREFVTDSFLHLELLDLWQRLLGTPDIGLDDDFFDKGGDSLLAVKLLLEVEAIAGKPYPQSELSTLTIRRIAEVLRSDMPAQRDLMTQVKSGSGIPLFFCHGDYIERGIYAQKLAALLPDDQPVFLLHCYADQFLGSSIEEIAQVYLRQVLSAAPGSPVFVAGYCNGGTVAWHLAHLLRSAGVEVVELLLIETPSLNARPALRELPGILDAAGALIPGRTGRALREHGMRYVWYLVRGLGAGGFQVRRKVHVERRKPLLGDANAMATRTYFAYMSRYVPPAIDVGVTCFIADQGRHFDTDPTYWRHLAPSVGKVSAPGTHQGMCVSGRQVLAIELAEVLDRATRHFLLRSDRPGICVREVALG